MRLIDPILVAIDTSNRLASQFGSLTTPIPILSNGIKDVISELVNLKIDIECIPWRGDTHFARMHRYPDHAEIWYSSDLNTCWSRFVLAKELTHLLCGDERNFSSDPVSIVNGLLMDVHIGMDDEIDAEWACMFGAIELLVPKALSRQLYEMEDSGKSNLEIALEFRVPEKVISFRLSSGWREIFDRAHQEMHTG